MTDIKRCEPNGHERVFLKEPENLNRKPVRWHWICKTCSVCGSVKTKKKVGIVNSEEYATLKAAKHERDKSIFTAGA